MSSDDEKYTPLHRDDGAAFLERPPAPTSPNSSTLSPQQISNYKSRVTTDLATLFGTPAQAIYDGCEVPAHLRDPTAINAELQEASIIGNGAGFILGWLIHILSMRFGWYAKYANDKSKNPFFRALKTSMVIGLMSGGLIANLLPLPESGKQFLSIVIANSVCVFFGLFVAAPYCLIRSMLKIDPEANAKESNFITGKESWSKFEKTAQVGGLSLGQIGGAIYSHCVKAPLTTSILIGSEIAGLASVVIGIITVPLINRFFGNALKSDPNDPNCFRNNYVRSGMTFATAVASGIGFFVGGPIGATIGGAIGNFIGGVLFGILGSKISSYTQQKWNVYTKTENPWDYATRSTASYSAGIGSIIGFFLPIPFGMLAGGFIGGAIGWLIALPIIRAAAAKRTGPTEEKSPTLSWNERLGNGGKKGLILGGLAGLLLAAVGGPVGIVAGIGLGAAIGSTVLGAFEVLRGRKKPTAETPSPVVATPSVERFTEKSAPIPIPNPRLARRNHEIRDISSPSSLPTPAPNNLAIVEKKEEFAGSTTAITLKNLMSIKKTDTKQTVETRPLKEECISNEDDEKPTVKKSATLPRRERFTHVTQFNLMNTRTTRPTSLPTKRHPRNSRFVL